MKARLRVGRKLILYILGFVATWLFSVINRTLEVSMDTFTILPQLPL